MQFLKAVSRFLPWTQWLARIFMYGFFELFFWAWDDSWFGKAIQARAWKVFLFKKNNNYFIKFYPPTFQHHFENKLKIF